MNRAQSGELHSREKWESVRDIVTRLYKIEQRPLREVRAILARDCGFIATPRQYKRRIKEWKAFKSSQENGIQSPNTSTLTDSTAQETQSLAEDNTSVICLNLPAYSSLEWPVQSPGHLRSMELAKWAIQSFFPSDIVLRNLNVSHKSDGWDLGQFYALAQTISASMAASPVREVSTLYTELQILVERIIHDKNPIIPTCILQVCSRFLQENQIPVLRLLLAHISAMAGCWTKNHPLQLLCNALLYSLDFLPYLLVSGSRVAVEAACRQLTPEDPQTLSAQRGLYSALIATGDFAGALRVCANVMDMEVEHERENSGATRAWRIEALTRLICCELSAGRLDDAECHLGQLASFLTDMEGVDRSVLWKYQFVYSDYQGELLRLRMDPTAVTLIQKAYDLATKSCPPNCWWWVIYAKRHLDCAKSSGMAAEALPFSLPC